MKNEGAIEMEKMEEGVLNKVLFGEYGDINKMAIRAIEAFGAKKQLAQLQEENAELIQAVSKYTRAENSHECCKGRQSLIEEIADNIIMLNQAMKILQVSETRMLQEIDKKLYKLNGYLDRKGI